MHLNRALIHCRMACLGTFVQLLSHVVFVMVIVSVATGAAHLILRWKKPEFYRPYRTWDYPMIPVLFIMVYLWIGGQIFMEKPSTSLIGLCLAVSGLPFYFCWTRSNKSIDGGRP